MDIFVNINMSDFTKQNYHRATLRLLLKISEFEDDLFYSKVDNCREH
jgi:hypothetical protein